VIPFGPKFPLWFGNLYLATTILIITFGVWFWRSPFLPRPFSIPVSEIVVSIVILLAVMSLSALQSISFLLAHQENLLRYVQFLIYTCFFIVLLQMPFSKRGARAILFLAVVAGVGQGLLGVWQWVTNPGFYVTGTFDYSHSNYAVYIVFITLLIAGVLLESRSRIIVACSVLGLAALLYSITFSFSRGGYVALGAGFLVMLAMPIKGKRRLLLAGTLAGGAVLFLLVMPQDIAIRLSSILKNLIGGQIGISWGGRLSMWKDAFTDFTKYPLLGRGTWSYHLRDNFFMKTLGEGGLLGFLAFVGFLYILLRTEWRSVKAGIDDDFVRGIAYGLLPATVACLIVFNLSGDFFGVHRFMGSFWIVLAMVLKYCEGDGPKTAVA
jgi:O-antigen ligase